MGLGGILIWAAATALLEDLHVYSNRDTGIGTNAGYAIVKNCTVELHESGLSMISGLATNVVVRNSTFVGIYLSQGRLLGSTVTNNAIGLAAGPYTSYTRSVFMNNGRDFQDFGTGPSLNAGENICSGGVICPGFLGIVH